MRDYTGKKIYQCDPDKNITCRKTACYLWGGECRKTTNPACRMRFAKIKRPLKKWGWIR